jgi:hypothetical protein
MTIIGASLNVQIVVTSQEIFAWIEKYVEDSFKSAWGMNYQQIFVLYRPVEVAAMYRASCGATEDVSAALDAMLNCECDAFLVRYGLDATALG